jgi:hypothetical protein
MSSRPSDSDLRRVINYTWQWGVTEHRSVNAVERIPLDDILIETSSASRLEFYIDRLKKGRRIQPIEVSRIRVGARVFYDVGDGNHRVAAARLAGRKTIKAMIHDELTADGAALVADTTRQFASIPGLWRKVEGKPETYLLRVWKQELTESQWSALLWLVDLAQGKSE